MTAVIPKFEKLCAVQEPLVSVVMPARNEEKYIGTAIESILRQSYTRLELIIVDDRSSDRSLDVVRSFMDSRITLYQKQTSEIRVFPRFHNHVNIGEHHGSRLSRRGPRYAPLRKFVVAADCNVYAKDIARMHVCLFIVCISIIDAIMFTIDAGIMSPNRNPQKDAGEGFHFHVANDSSSRLSLERRIRHNSH